MVAKRETVVAFGLVSCRRVSKVPTVTRIVGFVAAKRRTVRYSGEDSLTGTMRMCTDMS